MKKHVFFTGIATALTLAVILFSSSYAMAQATPFDIGLLGGDTDILVGQIIEGDDFPTIDIIYSSDFFDILLEESGGEANFVWNPEAENIDFLLVRTILPVNEFSDNYLSITLSTDEYALSYEDDPPNEITVEGDTAWPDLLPGDSIPSSIIWNFNDYAGADPERRLLVADLMAGDIDDNGDEMGVGVIRLSEGGNRYKIIALSGTVPTDNIFASDGPPFSEVLGIWETDTLEGEFSFTKSRNSDEYLYIIIQNWSTSELDLDEEPEEQFICDNFDRWLGPEGGEPHLALIGNPQEISVFGAGISVILTPFDPDPNSDPNNSNQYQINDLDGAFSVYVTETRPNLPEQFQPEEVALQFTWDDPGSGGGCSTVEFVPGLLLLLLPLFSLFK